MLNEIHCGDSFELIKKISDNSVDLVVTDPPYFIDGLGDEWDDTEIATSQKKAGVVGGLPVGMKFDVNQGLRFQDFMGRMSCEIFRVLKPGGFFICFSQARLYHRLAVAAEDAGFEIRDMLGWCYEGQAKAFSMDHFVRKMKISDDEKISLIGELAGRKTPQLKPQIEPMILGQKPKHGTFIENWIEFKTGLIDTTISLDGKFPGNLMYVKKPTKNEKGEFNDHVSVKPVAVLEHLIKIFSAENQVVLDPFIGSGSTAVAAIKTNRSFIGFEKSEHFVSISNQRVKNANQKGNLNELS